MYPPDRIIALAHRFPENIVLNIRPAHWPDNMKREYSADGPWQARTRQNKTRLMYPPFSRFLLKGNLARNQVLMSYQDPEGGIFTTSCVVQEVIWEGTGANFAETERGGLAHVRPTSSPNICGNFILAISKVPSGSIGNPIDLCDPEGVYFERLFESQIRSSWR
ncbi:MAG: hypothetical protein PHV99_03215 [Candidatus Pacebacteria bacterium]|nr:hypothetical protein [Candidatus Paceibacterota bacterium]